MQTSMDYDIIFVAGPQGSGKGTQGKRLAEKLGFLFWEMGGTLRAILAEGGPLAAKISGIDHGKLLSDKLIIEILKERLPQIPKGKGVIFDGVPRRIGQSEFLVEYWHARGPARMATVFIELSRKESIKRLLLRAQHESRVDDTPEAITQRFNDYDEEMRAAMDYLKAYTAFFTVDGSPSPDEVAGEIDNALGVD
jgi:adenylate kinase